MAVSTNATSPVDRVTIDGDELSHAATMPAATSEIAGKILDIVFEHALNKFEDGHERLAAGRPKFLSVIDKFVSAGAPVLMCLPAFPFKSANKVYKVLGSLPDKAEELALDRLNNMCIRIQGIYAPGAKLTIISDGLVYNDLLSVSDGDTWAYGEALRQMAIDKGFSYIDFSRLRDLVDLPVPDQLNQITYVANATNFRRTLLNRFGHENIDIDQEIATKPDTKMTYLGYRRFLESDLKYIFPLGGKRSGKGFKRDVSYLAKQMLIRGYAFAGACKAAFPDHLRLSIHESTGEHKVSMSLLNTSTGFTTPWHCSVALMSDGEWKSAPMGDFKENSKMEIVYQNGRPSHFEERMNPPSDQETAMKSTKKQMTLNSPKSPSQFRNNTTILIKSPALRSPASTSEKTLRQFTSSRLWLSEDEERRIAELAKTLSFASSNGIRNEEGQLINPFLGSKHPQLNPTSEHFDSKAWLETVMGIMAKDPARYPQKVAGVAYKDLAAHGFGEPTGYQKTFGNYPLKVLGSARGVVGRTKKPKIQILRDFDGLAKSGEIVMVLGRPGSGCSTLLKTLSGETEGFHVAKDSYLNYQGISKEIMHTDFRGECIYQAENDVHFPQLTVGQTLDFAARARAPHNRIPGVSRDMYAEHLRDVVMTVFGLSHTTNTMVGNDLIRGVSGGERKRVSIAEASIAGSPLQCWDNSTRGLDSATALDFVRTLRNSTEITGSTAIVSIYQASQAIYDAFDKVTVLYEGRQIFFGHINAAKDFFVDLGFECLPRQTTPDFLTSLTNPAERVVRRGCEGRTPRTPDEFAAVWQRSHERALLLREIEEFDARYPIGGKSLDRFKHSRKAAQAKSQRLRSPYTISIPMQVKLCMKRGYQRLQGDMALLITSVLFNTIMALVVGSVFFNLQNNTGTLFSRGALIFFGIQLAAFASSLEVLTLFAQRPIVEKHSKYAFYHPFAEAISSMICDLPNKLFTSIGFSLALYFMTNLRRTPDHFFVFLLFTFTCTLTISMYFRCIGSLARTLAQALAPASVFSLALVIYTGFTIPTKIMPPWFRWINYINPVAYAFESLMINEFHDRTIPCTEFVPRGPNYSQVASDRKICATTGAAAGADIVDGDTYLSVNFNYEASHLWRNFGMLIAFMVFGCLVYLLAAEYVTAEKSKGEVLLFQRGHVPRVRTRLDEEADADDRSTSDIVTQEKHLPAAAAKIRKQTQVFHWDGVSYEIPIKGKQRKLLDEVDGWVKPGTLTALMGVSGAGKTTLLDVLASRVTIGCVTGELLVNGHLRDAGFQRRTGYVQQQDLHLSTSTVREALTFSAILRQPETTPQQDKIAYVDEVIGMLEMEAYADAVIGVPGEGLNVEQRKRLTIGVELAAKPDLLLFLDEPTSGLDSQTAWSICALLRKLAKNGQAILCTIHQPSATLFQAFDRLLLIAMEGKTLYFGDIGESSKTVTEYFERHGARPCGSEENPAEWMLEVTGAASSSDACLDWPAIWHDSKERQRVKLELAHMKESLPRQKVDREDPETLQAFAAPFNTQLWIVLVRVFQQYWRTPSYIYSKLALSFFSALFIGFSFWQTPNSLQGLQNQLFAVFILLTIFSNFSQQILPHFVAQRALYEARERPSKIYAWNVFLLSNILVEIPWNALMALLMFFAWYLPIGLYQNAVQADQTLERGILMFLFILLFMVFASTFTNLVIAGLDTAEVAGNLLNLMFSLALIFCGVLATPAVMPRFWTWLYHVSPLTYLVSGMLSVGLGNAKVTCAPEELLRFKPPVGTTCAEYLNSFVGEFGGYLTNASRTSTEQCVFCTGSDTNTFLRTVSADYNERWRNLGIFCVYAVFNVAGAIALYWLVRVPKGRKEKGKKEA